MTLWLVRAGKYGEREELALDRGLAIIGWEELPDLSGANSREALRAVFDEVYPDIGTARRNNWVAQVWAFRGRIQDGDLVALPLKHQPSVAFGRVTGDYRREQLPTGEYVHCRPVEWVAPDIPRNRIGQDLLYSLGAFMTVCQIQRNEAEKRATSIMNGQRDATLQKPASTAASPDTTTDDTAAEPDLETLALDQIRAHITRHFKGHRLAELVRGLLEAQGYKAYASPPGPDNGVDVIASKGPLGFEPPRLVVQVKSQDTPLERSVVTELQGAMRNFRAEHGMVVSWGGYKRSIEQERGRLYFEMRLWNADDLIRAVQRHYDGLPSDIQAEIPMKQVWMLVPDETQ